MEEGSYHQQLKKLMDKYAHEVYGVTKSFPKSELYGLTSQFRRASLSVVLNYIEGFGRFTIKHKRNFLRTSFGSLKESQYLIEFCTEEGLIDSNTSQELKDMADRIGRMLWGMLRNLGVEIDS